MAIQRHLQKVGAHSNQETRPCDIPSSRPTVAPDSQPPPTGRKRKRKNLSPPQQESQAKQHTNPPKRQKRSEPSRHRAKRLSGDKHSRAFLGPHSLKELDRRNALLAKETPQEAGKVKTQVCPKTIEEFARDGGPDLSDLRQYPESSIATEPADSMPSGGSRPSGRTDTTRKSSPYTPGFGLKLKERGVLPANPDIRAANDREWNEVLIQPRPSLSPSRMSDGHHRRFVKAVYGARNETEVMSNVLPTIIGGPRYPSGQNVRFQNLEPLATGLVDPKPDYYEGEDQGEGNRQLRDQLDRSIVPARHEDYPFLPNFFTEAKGRDGTVGVAQRQAAHDGAVGARGMHRAENHGRRRERFDNNARTVSSIFDGAGHLDIFTHHVSKPTGRGARPQTHMTPLRSYSLTDTPETFRQGVGAYRNASDYAHHHRTETIKNAHRRSGIVTPRLSISPRPGLTPLSCQTPAAESSDADTDSSSESEDSDGSDYRASSRARAKGKTLKPKVVFASPQRPAKRPSSPPRRELRPRRRTGRS